MDRRAFLQLGGLALGGLSFMALEDYIIGPRPMEAIELEGKGAAFQEAAEISSLEGERIDETIGGWTIGDTYLWGGSGSTRVGLDVGGINPAIYAGSETPSSAPFRVTSAGALFASSVTIAGGSVATSALNLAVQSWTTDILFSSASDTQINWTAGTIRRADGTTYSINAGNTGAMAALTYIYLDTAISTTALQITTTYSTAVGDGKLLIAAAQNHTAGASVIPLGGQQPLINASDQITALSIVAGNLAAGSVTATKISVSQLSAIAADLGSITAGTITGGTIRTAASGARIEMTSTLLAGYASDGTTKEFYAQASDGKLYAGGGNTIIESTGIRIKAPTAASNLLSFWAAFTDSYPFGRIWGDNSNFHLIVQKISPTTGAIQSHMSAEYNGVILNSGNGDLVLSTDGWLKFSSSATQAVLINGTGIYPGNQSTRYLYDAGVTSGLAVAGGPFSTTGRIYPGTGSALQTTGYITCEADGDFVFTGGNVGMGVSPAYRLDVSANVSGQAAAFFYNAGNNADRHGIFVKGGANDGSGTTHYLLGLDGSGAQVGSIQNSLGTFQLVDLSDRRTKTNIRDSSVDALGVVRGLRVRDFERLKSGQTVRAGFVAQEVQDVYPDMVSGLGQEMLGTASAKLIPVLTKAIQELDRRLAALETR